MKKKILISLGGILLITMTIININFNNNINNGNLSFSSVVKQAKASLSEDGYNVECVQQEDTKCDGRRNRAYP